MSLTIDTRSETASPAPNGRGARGDKLERTPRSTAAPTPAVARSEAPELPAKKANLPSRVLIGPRADGHWVLVPGDARNAARAGDDTLTRGASKAMITLVIDPRIEHSSPPLSKGELAALARQISALRRCNVPLLVWRRGAEFVLLDGHNRLWICLLLLAAGRPVPFVIEFCDLPDREAAIRAARETQAARRNLSDLAAAYFRGKEYLAARGTRGGDQKGKSKDQSDTSIRLENTAQRLALENGVAAITIKRDGNLAISVDVVADACGQRAMDAIMDRDGRVTRARVRWLAELEASAMRNAMDEYYVNGRFPKRNRAEPRTATPSPRCGFSRSGQ